MRRAATALTVVAFWLLGAVAPAYWHLVGTSYADLLTSVLVLAGLWLIARAMPRSGLLSPSALWTIARRRGARRGRHCPQGPQRDLCGGPVVRARPGAVFLPRDRLRGLGVFCRCRLRRLAAVLRAVGAARSTASSVTRCSRSTTRVFRSPDFPAANLPLASFVPDSLHGLIALPFRMATYTYWVYVEAILPDVRPGLLVVCLAASGLLWLFRRTRQPGDVLAQDTGPFVMTARRRRSGTSSSFSLQRAASSGWPHRATAATASRCSCWEARCAA